MLRLKHIRKSFRTTVAVDDLSLEIQAGEVFALLGPNGAGKSTSIHIAVGLLDPDEGEVDIGGFGSPRDPVVRAKIGVAPQSLALYDELTAEDNVRFFGGMYAMAGRALRARCAEVLELVGLTDRKRDLVKTYSGGMKRRLNLAVALVHDPPILLLDEPTVGVDPQSRNAILDTVHALAERGRTVLYTTHYMEEAQRLCSRVAIIDRGRLLALGTPDELIAAHGGESVVRIEREAGEERIRSDDPMRELTRTIVNGGGVRAIHVERPTLEDVFLNLTGRSLRD